MFRKITVVIEEGKSGTLVDFRRKELLKKEVSLGSVAIPSGHDLGSAALMFFDLISKNRGHWSCELQNS